MFVWAVREDIKKKNSKCFFVIWVGKEILIFAILSWKNKKGNIAPVSAGLTLPRAHQREEGNSRNAYKEEMNETGRKRVKTRENVNKTKGKQPLPFPL